MSTVAFTAETRPAYIPVAEETARNFTRLNGIPCKVITPKDFDFTKLYNPIMVKLWLWDFVGDEVDTVIWKDSDTVDLRPLGDLPNGPFLAVKDWHKTLDSERGWMRSLGLDKIYFNAGFFVARRQTVSVFKELQTKSLSQNFKETYPMLEQTWLNIKIKEVFGQAVLLPEKYNYFITHNTPSSDTIMLHYAGMKKCRYLRVQDKLRWLRNEDRLKYQLLCVADPRGYNGCSILTPHGRLLIYRSGDRLHSCFLDENFNGIKDTDFDLGLQNNNDPRLCWHDGELFLSTSYYEDWERMELRFISAIKHKKLQLCDLAKFDSFTCGFPKAYREKNWLPFSHNGKLKFVYSFKPHRILAFNMLRRSCCVEYSTDFELDIEIGKRLHLNTPPIRIGDVYLSSFHEREFNTWNTFFYTFKAAPPFNIIATSKTAVLRQMDVDPEVTNGVRLFFPQSAELLGESVLVFGGCNDNSVVCHSIMLKQILNEMVPVKCKS